MTARPHRKNKSDRLLAPGATPAEIQCDFALAPFDRVAEAMEAKWGIDRLPGLVSAATATKFGSAMAKLNAAIYANDPEEVAARAGVCVRGYAAMEAEAVAAGHQPVPPEAWEVEVDGKPCLVISDVRDWKLAEAARPGLRIYTLREVGLALAHYGGIVAAVKDAFPGAEVAAVRKPTELERSLEDEIPWL